MVQRLVGLGLAFVELLEAESARLKLNFKQILATTGLVIVGAVVVAGTLSAASGFLLWAAFLALEPAVGTAGAALVLGAGLWILVGGGAWIAANQLKNK